MRSARYGESPCCSESAPGPAVSYICTRPAGHWGDHAAHTNYFEAPVATWSDGDPTPIRPLPVSPTGRSGGVPEADSRPPSASGATS